MKTAEKLASIDLETARRLLESGYFDETFYRRSVHLPSEADAFEHFFRTGLKPNIVFDTNWYLEQNPDVAKSGINPLVHYALVGEAMGRDPSPLFDTKWYARNYAAEKPLPHYLAHRFGPYSPIPEFDAEFYLSAYPDVPAARVDPFLHYMHFGFREFRKPSADFNPRLYANRHLAHDRGANPIADLRTRRREGRPPERSSFAMTSFDHNRKYARAGPLFEPLDPSHDESARLDVIVLAYYLTQFHRVAENDAWWGEGFTEWTGLARGQPRFAGHYQPRIPGGFGFYDLSDLEVMRAQARRAKAAGVSGFVFYYYDFDGRRLLEKPLEQFLAAPDIDVAFCLMWANENWTRRWDGADSEILVAQTYDERDERRRCAEFVRHFRDARYLRIDGRPLLMVYRASLIPQCARTIARWRRIFSEHFGETPIFVMAQCFDDVDPRPLGFDGAVEFPPHKLTKGLPQIYDNLDIFDDKFEADVFAYDDLAERSLASAPIDYPLIQTAVPHWDNDARRQGQGLTLVGSTPIKYQRWLAELVVRARARPVFGQPLVCINAWNEWSEGAYLEPDVHFGWAYLNATRRAIFGEPQRKTQVVVAGRRDDPRLSDAARRLAAAYGLEVVWTSGEDVPNGASVALVGPGASGSIVTFARAGVRTVWLFEEEQEAADANALKQANIVLFADEGAKQRVLAAAGLPNQDSFIADIPPRDDSAAAEAERSVQSLRALLFPDMPKISVGVIHRAESQRARASLDAVFAQTYPVWEVLVFDERSSDASFAEIDACAHDADRDAMVVIEDQSAELAVSSWRRAVELTSGDYLWISDTEAVSDPAFLARLIAPMRVDPRLALVFCDCGEASPSVQNAAPQAPLLAAPKSSVGYVDATFEGGDFKARMLADRDVVKRLDCVLWRREALAAALSHLEGQADVDLQSLITAIAAAPDARIGYVAETLVFVGASDMQPHSAAPI